ncbi:hypothetical protein [Methylocella tundrae]|uniref:hypothetical protein n=1 Tax=Methylocella tundrae TaxID=227605 RepID=UPI0018D581DC|nr:hypothetical protein [Methylocella tundrae]
MRAINILVTAVMLGVTSVPVSPAFARGHGHGGHGHHGGHHHGGHRHGGWRHHGGGWHHGGGRHGGHWGTADGGAADGATVDGATVDGAMHKAEGTAMADAPGDGCSAPMAGIGRGAAGESEASGSLNRRSPARPQMIRASN